MRIYKDTNDIQLNCQNLMQANSYWMVGHIWPACHNLGTPTLDQTYNTLCRNRVSIFKRLIKNSDNFYKFSEGRDYGYIANERNIVLLTMLICSRMYDNQAL